jgi:membrane fusion protein, multidrug efflux system
MKKGIRPYITYGLILVIILLILYPKIKPLFVSNNSSDAGGGPGMQGFQQRALSVHGLIIAPDHMVDLRNSTGTLLPDEEVDLSFEASGKIVNINFDEGKEVKKGDLLAKVNDRHLQAQLLRLKAQRRLAEEREYRQRTLLSRDAISQESYDQVVTELETLDADILLVEARIAETELRAPFDGIIGLRYVSEGSFSNPNTRVARLIKISPLKIEFSIPERYSGEVSAGFPIVFTVDGIQEKFHAKVYAVDPMVDVRTRTILARALYPNHDNELKPGRFANISIQLSETPDAIAIPTEALIPEMDGDRVFVYRSGKASSVNVRTGLRTESLIQITSGLNFGDTLLTTGVLQLRHGLNVVLDTVVSPSPRSVTYLPRHEDQNKALSSEQTALIITRDLLSAENLSLH